MASAFEPLADGEARAYYAFCDDLRADEDAERCRALLSDEERTRELRFRFPDDQRSYLLAHALTRSVLAGLCGVPARELRFVNGAHGRPELSYPKPAPQLRFNLSHTHGLVACAVALERDVGVDVEHMDRRVEIDQLAPSVFSAAECAALARLPSDEKRARFFELWTLKEAYIKAVGKALALPLRAITLAPDALPTPRIAFAPPLEDDAEAWSLHVARPAPSHALALALRAVPPSRFTVEVRIP